MDNWEANKYNVRHYIREQHNQTREELAELLHHDLERLREYHYRLSSDIESIEERLLILEANGDWIKRMFVSAGVGVLLLLLILSR